MPRAKRTMKQQKRPDEFTGGMDVPFHLPPDDEPVEPETSAAKEPSRIVGGMVATTWAGIPMWRCPRCQGTTFDQQDARTHTCKLPKFADELDQ